ncbi:protein of unknown function [Moritella yayanosii]|uniref:Uncharacterized protein n=1 Tax=Moritella yayanosii TaxID=69539 RepID=A0A330LKU4_9GAMM|nr:protein of unknown function [Moritella yayanosii]
MCFFKYGSAKAVMTKVETKIVESRNGNAPICSIPICDIGKLLPQIIPIAIAINIDFPISQT